MGIRTSVPTAGTAPTPLVLKAYGAFSGQLSLEPTDTSTPTFTVGITNTTFVSKPFSPGTPWTFPTIAGTHTVDLIASGYYKITFPQATLQPSYKLTLPSYLPLIKENPGVAGVALLNMGTTATTSLSVNVLLLSKTDVTTMSFSETTAGLATATPQPYASLSSYTFTSTGTKTLYVQFASPTVTYPPVSGSITILSSKTTTAGSLSINTTATANPVASFAAYPATGATNLNICLDAAFTQFCVQYPMIANTQRQLTYTLPSTTPDGTVSLYGQFLPTQPNAQSFQISLVLDAHPPTFTVNATQTDPNTVAVQLQNVTLPANVDPSLVQVKQMQLASKDSQTFGPWLPYQSSLTITPGPDQYIRLQDSLGNISPFALIYYTPLLETTTTEEAATNTSNTLSTGLPSVHNLGCSAQLPNVGFFIGGVDNTYTNYSTIDPIANETNQAPPIALSKPRILCASVGLSVGTSTTTQYVLVAGGTSATNVGGEPSIEVFKWSPSGTGSLSTVTQAATLTLTAPTTNTVAMVALSPNPVVLVSGELVQSTITQSATKTTVNTVPVYLYQMSTAGQLSVSTQTYALNTNRYNMGAVNIGSGYALFAGGDGSDASGKPIKSSEVDIFNLSITSNTIYNLQTATTVDLSEARSIPQGASNGTYAAFVGGSIGINNPSSTVDLIGPNPANHASYANVAHFSMQQAKINPAVVFAGPQGNHLIIAGGNLTTMANANNPSYSTLVEVYAIPATSTFPATMTATQTLTLSESRSSISGVALSPTKIIFSGGNETSIDVMTFTQNAWTISTTP